LIHLIHLVLILLESSLVVIEHNLLLWTPVLVVGRLLTVSSYLSRINSAARTHVVSGCAEGLIIKLTIVAIALLLLGLHLQILDVLLVLLRLVHLHVDIPALGG
jgi:hypothetical protein